MGHITTGVEYGLHCLLYLVPSPDDAAPSASTRDLAALQGVPAEFVAKLFTKLQKAGIVAATEGIRGGFRLAQAAEAIDVLQVVEAIDGVKPLFDCREIRARCAVFREAPPAWAGKGVCSIHAIMLDAEKRMREALAAHTLADIAARVAGKAPPGFGGEISAWLGHRAASRSNKSSQTGDKP